MYFLVVKQNTETVHFDSRLSQAVEEFRKINNNFVMPSDNDSGMIT